MLVLFFICTATFAKPQPVLAQEFLEQTILSGMAVGGEHSDYVRRISRESTQLSDGTPVPFEPWYGSDWRDFRVTFLTLSNENLGIFWGFGTGERGEKYHIEPSLKLGFIRKYNLGRNSTLTFTMSAVLGGYQKESPCIADYGAILGIQTVNCRMADSFLPPEKTLDFLFDTPPTDQFEATLTYKFWF